MTTTNDRVLVTGAGGFIGRHLVRRLVGEGRRTIALGSDLPTSDDGMLRRVRGNVGSEESLAKIFAEEGVTGVVHLSAHPDAPLAAAPEVIAVNLEGTARLLRAASRLSAPPRVALASSIKVYGRADAMPITEATPLAPTSVYAIAKAAADQLGLLFHQQAKLPVTILRLTQVYGPGQPSDMLVQQFLDAAARGEALAMTKGEQTRDLLYVDDAVEAFVRTLDSPAAAGRVFNLGSGHEVAIGQLVAGLNRLLGAPPPRLGALPYREGEMWRLVVDPTEARDVLGFEACVPIEEGLRRTVASHVAGPGSGDVDE